MRRRMRLSTPNFVTVWKRLGWVTLRLSKDSALRRFSSKNPYVAIFWDYENCPVPSDTAGHTIVDNIRSLACSYGSVKSFKAYLGIPDQTQKSLALRSQLQSSGVTLVDCPHNSRKDVADKMIIVDMFAHAIDNPAPSTVVLITGDRDFAYPISILRLRRYRVILVTLSNAHASLTAQASDCLNWTDHVLALTEAPVKASNRLKRELPSLLTDSSSQIHTVIPSKLAPKPLQPLLAPSLDNSSTKHPGLNVASTSNSLKTIVVSKSTPALPVMLTILPHLVVTKVVPKIFEALVQCLQAHISRGTLQPLRSNVALELNKDKTMYAKAGVTKFEKYIALADKQGIIELGGKEEGVWIRLSPNWCNATTSGATDKLKFSSSVPRDVYLTLNVSQSLPHSRVPGSLLEHAAVVVGSVSRDSVRSAQPPPLAAILNSPLPQNAVSPVSMQSPGADSTRLSSYSAAVKGTTSSNSTPAPAGIRTALPQPTPLVVVPENFKALIRCLHDYTSNGVPKPFRNNVARELNKDKATYKKAGVARFGLYTALAERQGIVELGGKEEGSWIALKPKWFDAVS